MNLQNIQKRVEELSAELLTLSNNLAFILQGDISRDPSEAILPEVDRHSAWAEALFPGDTVKCVAIHSTNDTRQRCFTVGNNYIVETRLLAKTPDHWNYGIRVMRDDENEGHDACGVVFVKVG